MVSLHVETDRMSLVQEPHLLFLAEEEFTNHLAFANT